MCEFRCRKRYCSSSYMSFPPFVGVFFSTSHMQFESTSPGSKNGSMKASRGCLETFWPSPGAWTLWRLLPLLMKSVSPVLLTGAGSRRYALASGSMRNTMSLQRRSDSSSSLEAWSKIRTFQAVFSREQFASLSLSSQSAMVFSEQCRYSLLLSETLKYTSLALRTTSPSWSILRRGITVSQERAEPLVLRTTTRFSRSVSAVCVVVTVTYLLDLTCLSWIWSP
mmetsp:Transcript_7181/g.14941  ORF Transcript_7181/g.14941 Transcript_7181/m.14941 type:complete len:224 (+) Transcript_7181:326-997(+)